MKIALVTADYYVHIDYDLIPKLTSHFEIGWFPFCSSEYDIAYLYAQKKKFDISEFRCLKLKNTKWHRLPKFLEFYRFFKEIKKWSPDILYINADGFPWIPFCATLFFEKNKVIAGIHDVKPHSGASRIECIYKLLLPKCYKNLNTYSEFSYRQLGQILGKRKSVTLAHHPLTNYGECKKQMHEKCVFLFFGRICAYKGLEILITAGKKAYETNHKILIRICGKGPMDYVLDDLKDSPAFEIDNRHIPENEIPKILSDVDYWCLPYHDATQSGPMTVALNYRIPIIASNIVAFKEFSSRFDGDVLLVENNTASWTEVLLEKALSVLPKNSEFDKKIKKFDEEIKNEWIDLLSKK